MWRSPFTVCVHVLPYGPRLHYPFVEPNPPGQNQTDELVWTTSDSPVTKTIVFFIFVFNVAFEDSADPWCHVWCVMFLSCSPLQSCLCSTFCIPNTWFPNLTFSLTFDPSPVGHRVTSTVNLKHLIHTVSNQCDFRNIQLLLITYITFCTLTTNIYITLN